MLASCALVPYFAPSTRAEQAVGVRRCPRGTRRQRIGASSGAAAPSAAADAPVAAAGALTEPGFRCVRDSSTPPASGAGCAAPAETCRSDDEICINAGSRGSARCETVQNQCTQDEQYGGCYRSRDLPERNGEPRTACVNLIPTLRQQTNNTAQSVLGPNLSACSCDQLPCHTGNGFSCRQECGLDRCLNADRPEISTCAPEQDSGTLRGGQQLSGIWSCPFARRCQLEGVSPCSILRC